VFGEEVRDIMLGHCEEGGDVWRCPALLVGEGCFGSCEEVSKRKQMKCKWFADFAISIKLARIAS
jgi:hypothetical protein